MQPVKEVLQQNDSNNNNNFQINNYPHYNYDTIIPGGAIEPTNYYCTSNVSTCHGLLPTTNTCKINLPLQSPKKITVKNCQTTPDILTSNGNISNSNVQENIENCEKERETEIVETKEVQEQVEKDELNNKNDKLKPFKCEDCGKGFSQLRNYKYHR